MHRTNLVRIKQGTLLLVGGVALALTSSGCGRGSTALGGNDEAQTQSELTASCTSSTVKVLDLQADFRDIWKGTETSVTGKQADVSPTVGVDFNTTVQPAQVAAQFIPVKTDGSCGPTVPAVLGSSVLVSAAWGTSSSDTTRAPLPSTFNVLVRDSITGIVSAGGAVAAGGDVTLSSMAINGTVRQPVGLIAGGKITVSSGSVSGNVTYGVQSTFPQTVSVSGTKTLQPFATTAAFQDLVALSTLLADETPNGTATSANGTLQMTGSNATLNVFQVSSDVLSQASSVQLTVPVNAATIVNVTGNMTVALQNKGISMQGATAATLLWNVPGAAFVQISGVSMVGSILAPRALVTFDSGSINGTLVAQALASSGSGSLQSTTLNVAKLFGTATPSRVRVAPSQPLVRGCSYRFVIPGTVPLTSANGCLAPPLDVTFRVSASAVSAPGRELTRVEPDPILHTLRRFTARPGINSPVDAVWDRYQSSIGIAASSLVPTTVSKPSSTRPGQMVTVYQQYAQGYPVAGYGYFVATEGGLFRAANGKVMPGLASFPAPAVTATSALQAALTFLKISQAPWVTKPAVNHAPVGRLVVTAKRIYPTAADFTLAWDFRFGSGTGIFDPAGIQVDAATGTVLGVDGGEMSLTPLAAQAKYTGNQVNSTVDTIYDGNARPFKVASYQNPDQSLVTTLASGDIQAAGTLATVTGVTEDALGNTVGSPQYIVDPTPLTPWVATDKVEQKMATLQWALELSNGFMQSLNLSIGGASWQGIDGPTAHQKVQINYTDAPSVSGDPAHYSSTVSTPDLAQIFFYLSPQVVALQANSVGHEYTHVLIDGLRRASGLGGANGVGTLANYNEAGSLNEGLADLFAVAFNHSQITQSTPWYCIELDFGKGPECSRNIQNPLASTYDPLHTGVAGLPNLYKDVALDYGDYSALPASACTNAANNDHCGVHQNSTIISHWGYLLGMGTGGINVPCGLSFAALDSNPDTALRMALNIALIAVSTRTGLTSGGLISTATFADFRDATLQVADELVTSGVIPADAPAKIELAWAAVGLPPFASHSDVAAPANLAGAYPWATFTWPLVGDGMSSGSWDFQLTNASFDTNLAFHQEGITATNASVSAGVLPLALPSNSAASFFWRVRPSNGTLPWERCFPVHSFTGTTVPDSVKDLQIAPSSLASVKGDVLPGVFDMSWDVVRGTITPDYDVFIGPQDPQCKLTSGITQITPGGMSNDGVTESYDVPFVSQPKTHYVMSLRPIGPPDFTGTTTRGDCTPFAFDTADLLPPTITTGNQPGQIYSDHWIDVFNWKTSGGAVKSQLTLYPRDTSGKCGTTPIGPAYEVQSNCARSCDESFTLPTFTGLPNPTGYCWTVVDVAANGKASPPSAPPTTIAFSAFTLDPKPGAFWADVYNDQGEGSIPGDSYGKDVTFSWTTLPNFASAPSYGFKLGRWFWPTQLSAPDPANCVDDNTSLNLCQRGPTAGTLFETSVKGASTLIVPAAQAGKGRYCWGTWPIFDDPAHPGTPAAGQPTVDFQLECYTTGPAMPRILPDSAGPGYSVDPAVPASGFPQQAITGQIELDYVPDNQMKIIKSPGVTMTATCQPDPDAQGHQDYYNCVLPFSIAPQKNGKYTIEVQTFNSEDPDPSGATSDPLQDVVRTITVGGCGAKGQDCCPNNACDQGVCSANKCVESVVTILSPQDGAKAPPGDILIISWKDPNPTPKYSVYITTPDNGITNGSQVAALGTAATVQQFQLIPADEVLSDQKPFIIKICPAYSDGSSGTCAQRTINGDPPPNCNGPLAAPALSQPPLLVQGLAGCTNIDDVQARLECIIGGGPASDLCQYFIDSVALGLGWPAVPGATSYQVTQFGAFTASPFTVPGASGQVQTNLQLLQPLGGTVEACGFNGYGVAVTAIDSVCNRTSTTSLTGIGYTPQGP